MIKRSFLATATVICITSEYSRSCILHIRNKHAVTEYTFFPLLQVDPRKLATFIIDTRNKKWLLLGLQSFDVFLTLKNLIGYESIYNYFLLYME